MLLTGASSKQRQHGPLAGPHRGSGWPGKRVRATRLEKQQGEQGKYQKKERKPGNGRGAPSMSVHSYDRALDPCLLCWAHYLKGPSKPIFWFPD